MNRREITLHAFCSVKGGVGKSTLAVACAKLLAQAGETCVVIDADLTGTSLADGLRLQAPKLPVLADGTLDLDAAPSGEFYSVEETRAEREKRRARDDDDPDTRKVPPVYFNDALLYRHDDVTHECGIDAMFWRHEQSEAILYLPSSSVRSDTIISLGWLYAQEYEFHWQKRLCWLIDEMSKRIPTLGHVIIDLPPGVLGFTLVILDACAKIAADLPFPDGWPDWMEGDIQWRANPCLVTSEDENDLRAALEFYRFVNRELELRVIVNRIKDPAGVVRSRLEGVLPEQKFQGVKMDFIGQHDSTLGKIFKPGVNNLDTAALTKSEYDEIRGALLGSKAES